MVRGGYLGSLFELSDLSRDSARASCRYLLGAFEPLRFFLIEYYMYHSISLLSRLTVFKILKFRGRNEARLLYLKNH